MITEEQLEKEGWNYMTVFDIGKLYSKHFTGYWWEELYAHPKGIKISKKNFKEGRVLYDGECDNITTLRFLCRLFKIK